MLTTFLLLALALPAAYAPAASATNLANAGYIANFEGNVVGWWHTNDGETIVVNESGGISAFYWSGNQVTNTWGDTIDNVTVNCGAYYAVQNRLALCTDIGVQVYSSDLETHLYTIATTEPVDAVSWDGDGDLWVGLRTSRRAMEYTDITFTGSQTAPHAVGLSAVLGMPNGSVVTAGRDLVVRVHDEWGVPYDNQTLMDIGSAVSGLHLLDSGNTMLVASEGGQFVTYTLNGTLWELEEDVTLNPGGIIRTVVDMGDGRLAMGTHNGHLYLLNSSDRPSELARFSNLGNVVGVQKGEGSSFRVLTAGASMSDVVLFDLDSDSDGHVDTVDDFPEDATQHSDSDGDGYGDDPQGNNSDVYPFDATQWSDRDGDGYGDNVDGTNGDEFPDNYDQHVDTDGDGYGDNPLGQNGDRYPNDSTQWRDSDGDGYGDEQGGNSPDGCPDLAGNSYADRVGCPDSDGDGFSNPLEGDPTCSAVNPDGADAFKLEPTQWCDNDEDGYGDNTTGDKPDFCPSEWGNSTRAVVYDSVSQRYGTVQRYGCPDNDGDGYEDSSESREPTDLTTNKTEWVDSDQDGWGDNADWDDIDPGVRTQMEYCLKHPTEYFACDGLDVPNNQTGNASEPEEEIDVGAKRMQLVKQFLIYGGGVGAAIIAIILIVWGLVSVVRTAASKRRPDAQYDHQDATKELEASEEGSGYETRGGIIEDKAWDNEPLGSGISQDVPSAAPTAGAFKDGVEEDEDENEDEDESDSSSPSESADESEDESDVDWDPEPSPAPEQEPAGEAMTELPSGAPELPEEGLPSGWTMEQWAYYGHQWLSSQDEQ